MNINQIDGKALKVELITSTITVSALLCPDLQVQWLVTTPAWNSTTLRLE